MITLGINAAFHDSAAALVVDGVVVAAAEEERFTRIKHGKRPLPFTTWELPFHAIDYCLARPASSSPRSTTSPTASTRTCFLGRASAGDAIVAAAAAAATRRRTPAAGRTPGTRCSLAYVVERAAPARRRRAAPPAAALRAAPRARPPFRWHFVDHHLCHQASAFLAAPFERCAVMTLDGRGERATTTYGAGRRRARLPAARRGRHAALARPALRAGHQHLGFLHSSDEYKVMALAALRRAALRRCAARARPRRTPTASTGSRRSTSRRCSARARARGAAARAAPLRHRRVAAGRARGDGARARALAARGRAASATSRWPAAWRSTA